MLYSIFRSICIYLLIMTHNKRLIGIVSAVFLLLLVPFIAMQFSNEVNWNMFDFLVAGGLLLGTGLSVEFVLRKVRSVNTRAIILLVILAVLILLWLELAVGVFGSPIAGS